MDSYLKKDTYSHQRAAFYKRLHQKGISSKLLSYIESFVQTQNTQVYKRYRILIIYYNIDNWNQAYVPIIRAYFFSLQNLTQTKTHQFVLIMAISSKVFQNMKKVHFKKPRTPFAFKYRWGSMYQLGKGEKKKRGKEEKGKRRKREKGKRRKGEKK